MAVRWLQISFLGLIAAVRFVQADVLNAWNDALLDSIRAENTHPCVAARALAIVHGAMFDVSANIAQKKPFHTFESAPRDADILAALNSAAYTASTNLFPSRTAAFSELYRGLMHDFAATSQIAPSIRFGSAVADGWIRWRANDGSSGSRVYIPDNTPGAWRRTPPYHRPPEMQHWRRVVPFMLLSASQFRPPGPPDLASGEYAHELSTVINLGGIHSEKRTSEQTELAKFWSDFSYSVTPPGHWNQIAQAVARTRNMPLEERVRLFAILNLTMSDVAVACWDAKFAFNFWRPVTAVRAADSDPNPDTASVDSWMPLLNTPAFPEYVSGHSAFSAAAAVVLSKLGGGREVHFSVPSDTLPGKVRTFENLWDCALEVSQSRLYGGIHFPSALKDGLEMGENIANYVLEKNNF